VGLNNLALAEEQVDSLLLCSWHANLIEIDRCHCILFVNGKKLFNFLIADISVINEQ